MSRTNGNTVNGYWYGFAEYKTSLTDSAVVVTVTKVGMRCVKSNYKSTNVGAKLTGTSTSSVSGKTAGGATESDYTLISSKTYTYPRSSAPQSKTIRFEVTCGGSIAPGTSSGTITVSVPAAYTPPTLKCKAYRVSASASGYAPSVDPNGTRGYYEVTLSGGDNWSLGTGHELIVNGRSCNLYSSGDKLYGYTLPGAVPGATKATAKATIYLYAMGSTLSLTGTTYIAPISHMIDIAPNCVAFGISATEDYDEMTLEVGCRMLLNGAELDGEDMGAWSVVKLPGGFKMACAKITFSNVTFSSAGNLYRSAEKTVNIPTGIFTGAPHVVSETAGSNTLVSSSFDAASATQIKGYLYKLNSTTANHTINLWCFGK